MKNKTTILLLTIVSSLLFSCGNNSEEQGETNSKGEVLQGALPSPYESGELVVLVNNSVTSFYIYKGEPMGFEYEMLKKVCKDLGLELKVKIIDDGDHILDSLRAGHGHIVAANLTISKERLEKVNFTKPVFTTHQVLVQKKPDNWRKMNPHTISKVLIRDPLELDGDTITVRHNTSYYQRLINFVDETTTNVIIDTVPGYVETEELIEAVHNGDISYTMADENVASINATYFSNVDIKTKMSLSQPIGWAVNKNNTQIEDSLNGWITENKGGMEYNWIYKKYFKAKKGKRLVTESKILDVKEGNISPYDELIKEYAAEIGWDWRFLTAQIGRESRFDPKTVSWVGAKGLMQLMPATAEKYGVVDLFDPEQNIKAGIKYLQWLDNYWKNHVKDSTERVKFILASYNTGQGHVMDAVRLAKKHGLKPNVWEDNVEKMLKNKSKEKYHEDAVVKHGYCRGIEPVQYVREIYASYELYKTFNEGKFSNQLSLR